MTGPNSQAMDLSKVNSIPALSSMLETGRAPTVAAHVARAGYFSEFSCGRRSPTRLTGATDLSTLAGRRPSVPACMSVPFLEKLEPQPDVFEGRFQLQASHSRGMVELALLRQGRSQS
eukprot:CAMPEP_0197655772 /NCGR_PEP_ID=MMETSP1338-20131121/39661_1 /TAXON_ID=43686 ORGANISM="Pelagodinium beii, Strain RCC1491" /NCGR_SAMPLE_ID=MMETSP1338 /ASSEMBLY_ACC=CAM_ASM_000754 /LENGTH=117 /DNA_ID=CAMNT_0043231487 /DNA_START=129 /DNA_END=482 /DNA_ORIENTATION=+